MKKKRLYILFIAGLIMAGEVHAQQIPQFRHRLFSNYYYNPAYICDPGKPEIVLNHRSQWTGFEGSPTTSSLAGSYMFRDDMAGGVIISSDKSGAIAKNLFSLNYGYNLKINTEWNISFGLAWTIMQSKIDGNMVDLYDDNDEVVIENLSDKIWKPDANAGIMLYSDTYYAGFSSMQLFKTKYQLYDASSGSIDSERHYFLNFGSHIPLGRNQISVIHPDLLMEFVSGSPFSFDLSGIWEYNNAMLAGITYSHTDAISLNLGYKYQGITFMYSYDIVISYLMSAAKGAHEITLAYDLQKGGSKHYQPMF